jgi:hypothetical protein
MNLVAFRAVAILFMLHACIDGGEAAQPQPPASTAGGPFSDGFEGGTRFKDLFPVDLSRWHGLTLQPNHADRNGVIEGIPDATTLMGRNHLVRSTQHPHSGGLSLKAYARPYDGTTASKADVSRELFRFGKGDTVTSTVWYFIESGSDLTDLFLWDLEAQSRDPRYVGQPGRRLYLQTGEALASDLGKWLPAPPIFRQKPGSERPFPKDRWVRVDIRLFLSEGKDGTMAVWQDGVQVIDGTGQTLPEAGSVYNSLEVGITANGSTKHAQTVFVDDVMIRGVKYVQP